MKHSFLGWIILAVALVSIGYTYYETIVIGNFEAVNLEEEPAEGEEVVDTKTEVQPDIPYE